MPAKLIPFYSVHAVGGQINYIPPAKNLLFFFKGYDEYRALARVEGRTIVFGFSWTWGFPKAKPAKVIIEFSNPQETAARWYGFGAVANVKSRYTSYCNGAGLRG